MTQPRSVKTFANYDCNSPDESPRPLNNQWFSRPSAGSCLLGSCPAGILYEFKIGR